MFARLFSLAVLLLTSLGGVRPALADAGPGNGWADNINFDVEVDPFAYLFEGFSLHAGARAGNVRLALGAFAARYPDFLSPNDRLDARQHGAGFKLDWRILQHLYGTDGWLDDLLSGPFVGLGASYSWLTVQEPRSTLSNTALQVRVAARCGWEIPIVAGLYATPWISVGYAPGAHALVVAGEPWEGKKLTLFATVHIGWRLP